MGPEVAGQHRERLDRLATGLRHAGLDARVEEQPARLWIGPADRGTNAEWAVLDVAPNDLDEYLADVAVDDVPSLPNADAALAVLRPRLIESLTALHRGGDSNLTTRIFLRRSGPHGRLGLDDDHNDLVERPSPREDGPYEWVADGS